jgi:hypothetical protein
MSARDPFTPVPQSALPGPVVPSHGKLLDPFRPPSSIKFARQQDAAYDSIRKLAKVATLVSAVTIVGLIVTPFLAVLWGITVAAQRSQAKAPAAWFQKLSLQYEAQFVDIAVYVSGHPRLINPGRCVLFIKDDALYLHHRDGLVINIPATSMTFMTEASSSKNVGIGLAVKGLVFFHTPTTEYLSISYRDDKGFSNELIVASTVAYSASQWAAILRSARYEAV